MASKVIQLAERRPVIRATCTARAAADWGRERAELWDTFMDVLRRRFELADPVALRDVDETISELIEAMEAALAREQVAASAAAQALTEARARDSEALLNHAVWIIAQHRHAIALGREAVFDALALLHERARLYDPPFFWPPALQLIFLEPMELEARAARLRRTLRLPAP